MRRKFFLVHPMIRERALEAVRNAPSGWCVTLSEPARNLDQNAAMWVILDAFSNQLQWPVNGVLTQMSAAEWKDVMTAAFEKDARVAAGLAGGFVFLGQRTSEFNKRRFSEFIEFLNATAAERGVTL